MEVQCRKNGGEHRARLRCARNYVFASEAPALCRPAAALRSGVFVCNTEFLAVLSRWPGTRREIAVVFAGTRGTLIQSATDKRNGLRVGWEKVLHNV